MFPTAVVHIMVTQMLRITEVTAETFEKLKFKNWVFQKKKNPTKKGIEIFTKEIKQDIDEVNE